jgi:hypothetical protein
MALATLVAIAGMIWGVSTGVALLVSAKRGIGAGLAVFFAWALGRELDPDHDLSAFVGIGLALIALLPAYTPPLLVVLWLMLVLRMVNRTVGLPAKPVDSLAVLGFGTWLTWQGYWMVGLLTAAAFLLDGLLSPPLRTQLLVAGLTFVATVVLSVFHGDVAMADGPTVPVVVASVAMAGLFLFVIATSRQVRAVGDATGKKLQPRRVQSAQVLALATALLFAWWDGASGVVSLLPLWAAMTGVTLYRLAILFLRRGR